MVNVPVQLKLTELGKAGWWSTKRRVACVKLSLRNLKGGMVMKSLVAAVAASGLLLGAVEVVAAEAPPLQQPPIELKAAEVVPGR